MTPGAGRPITGGGGDESHLGIATWAKIRTGDVDTLVIGPNWPTSHKSGGPETIGALGHRIWHYLTKTNNPAQDPVDYMKQECARLAMNHLVTQPAVPIFLLGDLNKSEDQILQWL